MNVNLGLNILAGSGMEQKPSTDVHESQEKALYDRKLKCPT